MPTPFRPDETLGQEPIPLFFQLAERLRRRILAGEWRPGAKLPTEAELVEAFRVSRPTVRRAKAALIREGYLSSRQGSGCYVAPPEGWRNPPPTVDNLDDVFRLGREMSLEIEELGLAAASEEVRAKLGRPEAAYSFRLAGVRRQAGKPISRVVHHLPAEFSARINLADLDGNPLVPQIERLTGVKAVEGIQTISLGRASAESARKLGLHAGAAVLVVESLYFDREGQVIQYVRTEYRDKLPYSIRVKRG